MRFELRNWINCTTQTTVQVLVLLLLPLLELESLVGRTMLERQLPEQERDTVNNLSQGNSPLEVNNPSAVKNQVTERPGFKATTLNLELEVRTLRHTVNKLPRLFTECEWGLRLSIRLD